MTFNFPSHVSLIKDVRVTVDGFPISRRNVT